MADKQQDSEVKNKVKVEETGPCKKKVSVEIPAEVIRDATDEQYDSLGKDALVPGFRKGRAPRRLLEKRFGKETNEQIKLKLLSDASDSAMKDKEIDVLREPNIDHENIELPAEGPLKFDFEVVVRPDFKLPKLEGIDVQKRKLEITDEQIDTEIEQLRSYSGLWVPKETAAEANDQIVADIVLRTEGVAEEEKLDNVAVYVRANGFVGTVPVPKLDEVLAGAKTSDTLKTTVKVPKTYFREQYRGKKVDIEISVREIKQLRPAELNEDFLKKFGVDTEGELRERMRDDLHGRLESQIRQEMTEQIYKHMLENTDFDLPLDVVAEQANGLLQRQYVNLLKQGLGREQIEEQIEQLRAASEERAKEQLKVFFIMDKVAEKLGIDVTEEEVNGFIAQLALQRGQRPERMKEQMARDGSLVQLRGQVREDKCVAKLLESAKVTEVEAPKPKAKPAKAAAKTAKKAAPKDAAKTKKTATKAKKTTKTKTDK